MVDPDKRSIVALAMFPSIALGLLNGLYLEPLAHRGSAWFWAADAGQFVVVPVFSAWLLFRSGVRPADVGLGRPGPGTRLPVAIGVCLVVLAAYWFAYVWVDRIIQPFLGAFASPFGYETMLPDGPALCLAVVLYLSATAAIVEEVVFRGLPWLYLSRWVPMQWRTTVYVSVTSLLFAVIHIEQGPHGLVSTFSLGLVAGLLYARIRNLWPFVLAHFVLDVYSFS